MCELDSAGLNKEIKDLNVIFLFSIEWAVRHFCRKALETLVSQTLIQLAQNAEIRLYCPQIGN